MRDGALEDCKSLMAHDESNALEQITAVGTEWTVQGVLAAMRSESAQERWRV